MAARLKTHYEQILIPRLQERLGIQNRLALPRLEKITVSAGVGRAKDNKKLLENATTILTQITGQKAVATRARVSIAQFKLREGMPVGCRVTLRGDRAYEFLDRLVQVVIPRIRDFRGLPARFDGRGNYNMGLGEQSVWPEIGTELLEFPQGMNIAITIRGGSDESSRVLLEEFGFPFQREEAPVA
jgi:large subunit ribosomal protein L5